MATTTNFGWETPDDTDLVKDGAAAIRTALSGVDTSFVDLKGGTTGQVLSKASNTDLDYSWTTISAGTTEINPNLIINGNFAINQRSYVSAANLASGSYGFDRWKSGYTNTSLTFTAAPAGQSVTISTSGVITQIVEQANVPAGTYTLSWSGTATGRIYNSGGSAPSYAASPIIFTADGSANVVVEFTASGSTKTLSKVKLELGSTATNYSYVGGTIQSELAECQRYYIRKAYSNETVVASAAYRTSTTGLGYLPLPVAMRGTPSISFSGNTAFLFASVTNLASTGLAADTVGATGCSFSYTTTAQTTGYGCTVYLNGSGTFYEVSAEL